MTRVESESTKTSLIAKDISYIQKDIADIKSSIKDLSGVYATKLQLDELSSEVIALKAQSNTWKIVSPLIASVVTAAVTFLLISYLQHLH